MPRERGSKTIRTVLNRAPHNRFKLTTTDEMVSLWRVWEPISERRLSMTLVIAARSAAPTLSTRRPFHPW